VLTWNLETDMTTTICACTIYRYKALESPVVILTQLGRREAISDQLINVGLSRARHHVVVIGELPPSNDNVS
jgi:hypothetical protein